MYPRVTVRGGQSSGLPRILVIHEVGPKDWNTLAEVDQCFGDSKGVKVHFLGKLVGTHPGWRYQPSPEDGVDYVIRMHARFGSLPAELPVVRLDSWS